MDFRLWALLSAIFAAATAILAKKGIDGVPVNLAVAVRVVVILIFAVSIAVATRQTQLRELTPRNWQFLILSGIATGASWLCYFQALKLGPVSKVAPIDKLSFVLAVVLGAWFLKEKISPNVAVGCGLIVTGVLVTLR